MANKVSAESVIRQAMQRALHDSSLSLDQALEKPFEKELLHSLTSSADAIWSQPEVVVSQPHEGSEPSTSVLRAAITNSFDLTQLKPSDTERHALLEASDLVMVGGQRRLRLNDAKRAGILDVAIGTDPFREILQTAMAEDSKQPTQIGNDPIRLSDMWLRRFLAGDFSNLDSAPPTELKAALEARERLRLVKSLPTNAPSIDDLARRVGLAELLEPLRLLIGAEGGYGSPRKDRFVGREEELRKLRTFVDELSSQSIGEAAIRIATSVKQTLTRSKKPALMLIQGRGGLGKSTLLAKFVFDHAMGQERPFPFAYLDFDRASLDAQRPLQLLIEIARQVGLQFPHVRNELEQLADSIRARFVGSPASASSTTQIADPFSAFAEILRQQLTFGKRAFLLVLDTMEAVQWDSLAMDRVGSLLDEFRIKGLEELRVVASGRAELQQVSGLEVSDDNIVLRPLLVKEARQLAEVLGRAAIDEKWNSRWSGVIAGKREDDFRREPLAVRVAVDLIARAEPFARERLVDEIQSSGLLRGDFVARLYLKRIVNHVRDPLAQKLAWPGLVVRLVTLEIARDVLAPLCGLLPDQAEKAFAALGREVWMVTQERDALRHRQDLRSRTLPLMRLQDASKFDEIARAALAYFEKYRQRSREDFVEWVYHRFLAGEAPEEVASDLSEELLPLLARAEEDFPRGSPAASYLAARTSRSRLSPPRIRALRPKDAIYHLSRTSSGVFALDDTTLDRVALDVSGRIDNEREIDRSLRGWAVALWIKTGTWQRVPGPEMVREDFSNQTLRIYLFWAAHAAPTLPVEARNRLLDACLQLCSIPRNATEFLPNIGVRATVQLMALARIARSKIFDFLDRQLATILMSTSPKPMPSMQSALRTAIVLGEASRRPALATWLASRHRASGDRVMSTSVSLAELDGMRQLDPDAAKLLERTRNELQDSQTRVTAAEVLAVFEGMLEETLDEIADRPQSPKKRALSRVFACRDEDWILPVAYAAARAHKGRLSENLVQSLNIYDPSIVSRSLLGRTTVVRGDMLSWMRLADEAGELAGFARHVLAECEPDETTTDSLKFLLDCRDAWSRSITDVTWTEDKISSAEPSSFALEEQPPPPGPIIHSDDPQKGRWGGKSTHDGRTVRVVIDSVEREIFYFSVVVESTDATPLVGPVIFHLHDSYPRSVVTIRTIQNQQAILKEWNAHGIFAIGVQVRNATGRWISLETDLADAPGLPKRFLEK